MSQILNFPLVFASFSLTVLWIAVRAGVFLQSKRSLEPNEQEDFRVVTATTITLLSLLVGFTFSMAISRYDLRKSCEETEANAIGTEYSRAGLLPPADAARVRALLRSYLEQRILFYQTRNSYRLRQIDVATSQLQTDLWSAVSTPAEAKPTPVVSLAVSGMNAVFDSEGYTQGAWWNRIPISAWILMVVIAICSNVLFGYSTHPTKLRPFLILVLPIIVSIAFFLIADIDSTRNGIIRINPQNLIRISNSLHIR